MKSCRVVLKPISGLEQIEYEVRLIRGGLNILINRRSDKTAMQALSNDLFAFLKGLHEPLMLDDLSEHTRKTFYLENNVNIAGVNAQDTMSPEAIESNNKMLRKGEKG